MPIAEDTLEDFGKRIDELEKKLKNSNNKEVERIIEKGGSGLDSDQINKVLGNYVKK